MFMVHLAGKINADVCMHATTSTRLWVTLAGRYTEVPNHGAIGVMQIIMMAGIAKDMHGHLIVII